ncbi:MAG: hypothetical protein ACXWU4_00745 [Allosphingosinicella sp.]
MSPPTVARAGQPRPYSAASLPVGSVRPTLTVSPGAVKKPPVGPTGPETASGTRRPSIRATARRR